MVYASLTYTDVGLMYISQGWEIMMNVKGWDTMMYDSLDTFKTVLNDFTCKLGACLQRYKAQSPTKGNTAPDLPKSNSRYHIYRCLRHDKKY